MVLDFKEHLGRPVLCQWCGNVRSKKVVVVLDGEKLTICDRHTRSTKGDRLDEPNLRAVMRVWHSRT